MKQLHRSPNILKPIDINSGNRHTQQLEHSTTELQKAYTLAKNSQNKKEQQENIKRSKAPSQKKIQTFATQVQRHINTYDAPHIPLSDKAIQIITGLVSYFFSNSAK